MTTTDAAEAVYAYGFSVWPDEHPRWNAAVYALFGVLTRVEMDFTERAFGDFREELARCGLTLREIDRVRLPRENVL